MTGLSTRITFSGEQAMLLETAVAFCREKSAWGEARKSLPKSLSGDKFFSPARQRRPLFIRRRQNLGQPLAQDFWQTRQPGRVEQPDRN